MPYDHGRFVWFENFSNDIGGARAFYSELFGWTVQPWGDADYQVIMCGETGIGGLMPLQPEYGEHPFWLSYLSVSNVDETGSNIQQAGGNRLGEPFDVAGVGRIALVSDPQGAMFGLFKGETEDPSEAEAAGSWWWNELWTTDDAAARTFYRDALGYGIDEMDMGLQGVYYILKQGERMRGGLVKTPVAEVAPYWCPYVRVDNCDETAKRATSLGATIMQPPTNVPNVGSFTLLADPSGATIAAMTPANS